MEIPSLFITNEENLATEEVNPQCQWVTTGIGVATKMIDGIAVKLESGKLYKHRAGQWREIDENDPNDQPYRDALTHSLGIEDGLYEMVGPRVNGNTEMMTVQSLVAYQETVLPQVPRDYAGIKAYLTAYSMEGIVFWEDQDDPECQKAKVKSSDMGIAWPLPATSTPIANLMSPSLIASFSEEDQTLPLETT